MTAYEINFWQPRVGGSEINGASNRRAMGYPDVYVPSRIENPTTLFQKLAGVPKEDLALLMEDTSHSLSLRYCAGHLLSVTGDPRIDVFSPKMIPVPGGKVRLGLDRPAVDRIMKTFGDTGVLREWIEKETPSYETILSPFRLAKYPVTNQEYLVFLNDWGSDEIPTSWPFGRFPHEHANRPVFTVSPEAADAYVRWLSRKTGRHFRLPREAEWEYAASGPAGFEFPWGDEFAKDCANTVETGLLCAAPVGMFPKGDSPFGISDMAGNVEEYVAEMYRPYPGASVVTDDLWKLGNYRIARGGSFTRFRDLARCRRRHGWFPKEIYVMGFRIAEESK